MEENNKYDNEYTYESENYEGEKDNSKRNKTIAIIILGVLILVVLLLLLRGCFGKKEFNKEKTLLEAGKEYYSYNTGQLPVGKGMCNEVTLKELVDLGMIDKEKYNDCNDEDTYVKVCRLESMEYHYVPILMCDTEDSLNAYGDFKEGTEDDLIKDESDVKFSYLVEYLDVTQENLGKEETYWFDEIPYSNYKTLKVLKYYSYKDKQYIWNIKTPFYYPNDKVNSSEVKEYYTISPSTDYINKNSENSEVAKWYKTEIVPKENITTDTIKSYYLNNGAPAYSATAPEGYTYNEGGVTVASRTRTFTKTNDGNTTFVPNKYYKCSSPSKPGYFNNSLTSCENNINGFTVFVENYYTCGAAEDRHVDETATCAVCTSGELSPDKTSCGTYSQWKYSATACTGDASLCQNLPTGPVTMYKWYRYENRSYYPSGSKTAAGEKTYYLTIPAEGYIQDQTTITTGWKWYKNVDSITGNYYTFAPQDGATKTSTFRYTDWSSWSTNYVKAVEGTREVKIKQQYTIQEVLDNDENGVWKKVNEEYSEDTGKLIEDINALGYELNNFEDILDFKDLRYSVKLYYRNKEEK